MVWWYTIYVDIIDTWSGSCVWMYQHHDQKNMRGLFALEVLWHTYNVKKNENTFSSKQQMLWIVFHFMFCIFSEQWTCIYIPSFLFGKPRMVRIRFYPCLFVLKVFQRLNMLSFLVRWKDMNHVMGQKCFYPFIRQFWTLYRRFVGMKEPHKRICSHIHPVAILTPRAQTHTWFQTHTSISYWLQETQPPAPLVFHSG